MARPRKFDHSAYWMVSDLCAIMGYEITATSESVFSLSETDGVNDGVTDLPLLYLDIVKKELMLDSQFKEDMGIDILSRKDDLALEGICARHGFKWLG
jgi:hypothetical protein